jgi:twitching motility protein PilT
MAAPRASRIDAFIDHLVRHDALGIQLESGKAALFRFRGGDRSANAQISHAQLEAILGEIAPPGTLAELRASGAVDFEHTSATGATVQLEVAALPGGIWRVNIVQRPDEAPTEPTEFDFGGAGDPFATQPATTRARAEPRPAGARRSSRPPRTGGRAGKPTATLLMGAPEATSAERAPRAGVDPRVDDEAPPRLEPRTVKEPRTEREVRLPEARTLQEIPARRDRRGVGESPADAEGREADRPSALELEEGSPGAPREVATQGPPRLHAYLRKLSTLGGSDLHLSAEEVPRCRVHGEIQPLDPRHPPIPDAKMREMLLELAPERARHQFETLRDADFGISIPGVARFRANYFEDRKGMGAVFRQIPFEILSPEQLGLPKAVLDLCWLSKGLVVVTGPTGSGKSTTLASLIDFINRNRTDHIVTIEDPIEFVHDNRKCLVNQREVGTHTESFKNALRAALREDPDIVLVGEMRDLETIAIAIETAETGHLVFGTLHTTTAASTVDRIIDQFPPDRQAQIRAMLSESLRGVIAQVLCKKQSGGRVAAYEILLTNPAVSNLIREAKTYQLPTVMQTARGAGMQTMNDHLFDLVKRKLVHPREAYVKSTDKSSLRELFKRENIALDLTAG